MGLIMVIKLLPSLSTHFSSRSIVEDLISSMSLVTYHLATLWLLEGWV